MLKVNKRTAGSLVAVLAMATTGVGASLAQAHDGADDPVGHNRGDDHGGLRVNSANRSSARADRERSDDNDGRRGNAGGGHHDAVDND